MANLTRFVLTAPVQGPVFDRIEAAYKDLDGFIAALKDKDIDTLHFEAARAHLSRSEGVVEERLDSFSHETRTSMQMSLRAARIYFRALLLEKLDELDAWTPKPKKERAK